LAELTEIMKLYSLELKNRLFSPIAVKHFGRHALGFTDKA